MDNAIIKAFYDSANASLIDSQGALQRDSSIDLCNNSCNDSIRDSKVESVNQSRTVHQVKTTQ
jgi:hypothetical protein